MAMFNSELLVYQRVYIYMLSYWILGEYTTHYSRGNTIYHNNNSNTNNNI